MSDSAQSLPCRVQVQLLKQTQSFLVKIFLKVDQLLMMFFRLPFAVISVIYQPELKNNNSLLFNEVPGDISGKV